MDSDPRFPTAENERFMWKWVTNDGSQHFSGSKNTQRNTQRTQRTQHTQHTQHTCDTRKTRIFCHFCNCKTRFLKNILLFLWTCALSGFFLPGTFPCGWEPLPLLQNIFIKITPSWSKEEGPPKKPGASRVIFAKIFVILMKTRSNHTSFFACSKLLTRRATSTSCNKLRTVRKLSSSAFQRCKARGRRCARRRSLAVRKHAKTRKIAYGTIKKLPVRRPPNNEYAIFKKGI